jgi:hypothetical protein
MSERHHESEPSRYHGPPPVVLVDADGRARLAPYLLSAEDVADLFRLRDSGTRFPRATIRRYRERGLPTVRVGRRVWFRLPDVLQWLDRRGAM